MVNTIFRKSLIIGLILLFIGASILPIISGDVENKIEKNSSSFIRIKSQYKHTVTSIIKNEQNIIKNIDISSLDYTDNIAIANTFANESYPSMVMNGIDGLITYEFKDGTKPFTYLKNSIDFGQSWSNAYKLKVKIGGIDISVNSPSLSISPINGYAYGTFLSEYNNSGVLGVFNVPDISGNLNNIGINLWDWSNIYAGGIYLGSWWGFKDITIKYHNYNNVPWILSYIGSTNYSNYEGVGPVKNAVMYSYLGPDNPNEMWIQWEPKFGNCSNLSVAMSDDYKKIYGVSEIMNGSNVDLLFFSGIYKTDVNEPYLDLDYYSFTGFENLYHPKIYVKGNNIYIAVENNLQEIILFKSMNGGKNWLMYNLTSDILPPNSNPRYANLFANETTLYCTFIESGNILITHSKIGIIDWSEPIQLNNFNGSVVSKYRFSEIIDMNHIVWTDDRNDNLDIYLYIPEGLIPPNTPTISGPTHFKPNQEKEFTFTTTDPNGDQIYYYIDWGDGTHSSWIGPCASGYQLKLSSLWTYKAKFIIKCKAKDTNGMESNYGILDISTLRSKTLNSNFIILLQNHPNFFPILQKLLNALV